MEKMFEEMKERGYQGGKVRIDHCLNLGAAEMLKEKILGEFPKSDIVIGENGGLCSFYAERGGLIVGYESV